MSLILKMPVLIPTPYQHLSFSESLQSSPSLLFLHTKLSRLPLYTPPSRTIIRMGGGPRTYPGGVSKWQWKRMEAKKANQLLKARLSHERQIYEMRERAKLKAAVSELERPWEVIEKAPNLFSVSADEQLKVLADRFQKPGGFDMWSERDGPKLFETVDGLPSARAPKLDMRKGKRDGVKWRRKGNRWSLESVQVGFDRKQREETSMITEGGGMVIRRSNSESGVYDMSLQRDGTYLFAEKRD